MGDNDFLGPNSAPIALRRTDKHGVNYDFSCRWVSGCVTTVDKQSFGFPLGSPSQITAYLLVREDFTKCNNGGVGGSCQVGCLLYTFEGGRGDAPSPDPCPGFDCRGCGAPFEAPECQRCCRGRLLLTSPNVVVGGNMGNASTNNGFTITDIMNGQTGGSSGARHRRGRREVPTGGMFRRAAAGISANVTAEV
ncbi:hypothetical protein B0H63DRAFT_319049 [Podospora didyma]|uniref:Uncharacterized protein n=1 Tax=Podospora didyma TaxID=330526 RepID=A0AAE0K6T3_9PEZI|nr:hypothetical protein B0H63DRAFT_319049 [Podospora didyma]